MKLKAVVLAALMGAALSAVSLIVALPVSVKEGALSPQANAGTRASVLRASEGPRSGILHFASPDVHAPNTVRRNLFAFVQPPPRPVNTRVVQPPAPVATAPLSAPGTVIPEAPREPDFPMRYIGRFGPDDNPIAVFSTADSVVNARAGDLIVADFRLSAVGMESVDVKTATGALRRVALQP